MYFDVIAFLKRKNPPQPPLVQDLSGPQLHQGNPSSVRRAAPSLMDSSPLI